MSANDRQVGGSHYKAELQHWDMIENHGIGYLEGCASKYLRKKENRLQDLEKGLHYTEKLIEMASLPKPFTRFPRGEVPTKVVAAFVISNDYSVLEHAILLGLLRWRHVSDLRHTARQFQQLIDLERTVLPNDSTSPIRTDVDLDATSNGEPAGLDLSASCGCGCGDEGRAPEGSGDRS